MVSFSGVSRNITNLSNAIAITSSSTSSEFTRPGDYCTIRLDSDGIPHVVWTDGRYNEMDIFYSHGLESEPTSEPTTSTTTSSTTTPTTDASISSSTTTEPESTGLMPIFVGGVIGVAVVLIVFIIIVRKKT